MPKSKKPRKKGAHGREQAARSACSATSSKTPPNAAASSRSSRMPERLGTRDPRSSATCSR